MKTVLLAVVGIVLFATMAWASCLTTTYILNGRTVVCTQCCYGNNCTVTCY